MSRSNIGGTGGRRRRTLTRFGLVATLAALLLLASASSAAAFGFITKWGSFGSADGQFNQTSGVATDAAGNVYVSDLNNRIQKFTSAGAFLTKWGSLGSAEGQFNSPFGIATDAVGNVYIVDENNNRIEKFTSSGAFLFAAGWGVSDGTTHAFQICISSCHAGFSGSGDGQFNDPWAVATDAAGNVYVVDHGNYRIQKFTSAGAFLTKWGSMGSGDGQFNNPEGVATDAAGNVYVADYGSGQIKKFTSAGGFLTKWASPGSGAGPLGIGTDPAGDVYVADYNNNQVQKFTSSGALLFIFGSTGSGDGQFNEPEGIATDCRGNVYVADTLNNRIQKLGEPGTPTLCPIPSNAFSFGKVKKNKRKGTAKLTVVVPGPGELVLRGKGLKQQRPGAAAALASRAVPAAGKVKLLVKTKQGKKLRKLNRRGKVKVKAKVTYTPTNGDPNTKAKRITLVKRR